MRTVYRGGSVWNGKALVRSDISVCGGVIEKVGEVVPASGDAVVSVSEMYLFPGFADVHTHLREPGFSYKETIATGTAAGARGGYTLLFAMPNLDPTPDGTQGLEAELAAIRARARIDARPYGAITKGRAGRELADMEAMAENAIGFSDDGAGVNDEAILRRAMREAARLGKVIAAHSEDTSLIPPGGCVHEGEYARRNGLVGIPSQSEWGPVERDLRLLRETGCAWHVCHVSTKESVARIRRAKAEGLNVTCETAPHYLLMNDSMLRDEGRFKMNPPLRAEEDRRALIEGLIDGTIDMIATDHAPHSAAEKAKGLRGSAMGVVGLETAFPLLYTYLVAPGIAPLSRVVDALTTAPRARFGVPGGRIEPGARADLAGFDPRAEGRVDPDGFLSMGRATPFAFWETRGEIVMTVYRGETVYEK